MADVLAHPPDLALAALVDRQLERVRSDAGHPRGRGPPVVQLDSGAQRPHRRVAHRRPRHHGAICLGDLEARVGQPVGELAVVGEEDQAGGVGVEPADRIQPLGPTDELDHRRPPLRIARGRDDARRLVDRVHDAPDRVGADPPAVDRDVVVRVDAAGRVEHRLTADPDAPGPDDLLRRAP